MFENNHFADFSIPSSEEKPERPSCGLPVRVVWHRQRAQSKWASPLKIRNNWYQKMSKPRTHAASWGKPQMKPLPNSQITSVFTQFNPTTSGNIRRPCNTSSLLIQSRKKLVISSMQNRSWVWRPLAPMISSLCPILPLWKFGTKKAI